MQSNKFIYHSDVSFSGPQLWLKIVLIILFMECTLMSSFKDTTIIQLSWSGGNITETCDQAKCKFFQEHFLSFASSNGKDGDWLHGTQSFAAGITEKIVQVNITLYGRLRCRYSTPKNSFRVLVSGTEVGTGSHEGKERCSSCFNCAEFAQMASTIYPAGWPQFNYSSTANNTITVEVTEGNIYLSAVDITFGTKPFTTTTTTTSTSTTTGTTTTGGVTTTTTTTTTTSSSTTTKGNTTSHSKNGDDSYGPEILLPVEDIIGVVAVGVAVIALCFLICFCGMRIITLVLMKMKGGTKQERKSLLGDMDHHDFSSHTDLFSHSGGSAEERVMMDAMGGGFDMNDIELGEIIGRGSYSDVYFGTWLGTEVAVKRVPATLDHLSDIEKGEFYRDFKQEAALMSTLRHPNVLQLIATVEDGKELCLVTEYMSRGSMYSVLHSPDIVLSWRKNVRKMLVGAAKGMSYLHALIPQIIHRDLKPHNLLVDENWKCKVCDFGLATMKSKEVMTACGTPSYSAPEVLRQDNFTEKADVYSFGMVMWECLTRSEPYPRIPPFHIVFSVGKENLRPELPHDISPPLAELITECWQEDPERRPAFTEILPRLKLLIDDFEIKHPTKKEYSTSSSSITSEDIITKEDDISSSTSTTTISEEGTK